MPSRSEERRVGKEWRSRWAAYHSSRRRHTRCGRDWSSDVCSSDLKRAECRAAQDRGQAMADVSGRGPYAADRAGHDRGLCLLLEIVGDLGDAVDRHRQRHELDAVEIGRASCRERVEISVGGVSFKQKTAYEMRT